ncbi:ABC transporter ATP-binding protein [Enterococcus faecalis]
MEKAVSLSLSHLEQSETYDMLTRLEGQVSNKPFQSLTSVINLITVITTLGSVLHIFIEWNLWITLFVSISSLIYIGMYIGIGASEYKMKYSRAGIERKLWYYSFLLTHDIGFKEIKTLNLKSYFLKKYLKIVNLFVSQESKILKKKNGISGIFSIFEIIISFGISFIAVKQVFSKQIEIGTGLLYISSIAILQGSVQSFMSIIYNLFESNRYMDLFNTFMEIESEEYGKIKVQSIESISLKNVGFSYNDDDPVLTDINITLNRGEIVSIVGENGCGKSTLLKILAGLYVPSSGCFRINGILHSEIDTESFYDNISCVFQDFLEYQGTLKENVKIASLDASEESIIDALRDSEISFLIENNQYLLCKQLGNWFEGGQNLSGGQWQKIALARFFIRNSSLNLLDEPSSSIDKKSERRIFKSFINKSKKSISVYVTHKMSIAKLSDRIIVLKEGKVVDVGTHMELINRCEYYNQLFLLERN